MRSSQKFSVLFLPLVCLALTRAEAAQHWNLFGARTGFSTVYPADWFKIDTSADRLIVVSAKGGVEGFPIKPRQARILVMEAPNSANATQEQAVDYYEKDSYVIISSKNIFFKKSDENGCSELTEVISLEMAEPNKPAKMVVPDIVDSDYFCRVKGRQFVAILKNWRGDKRQRHYQGIALRMAENIALDPG